MNSVKYDTIYYHSESVHNLESPRVVVPLLINCYRPSSVLDVGCGIGTWLKVFEEYGVTDYVGVDGAHVDMSRLLVSQSKFVTQDLTSPKSLGRTFDLIICLEVAEHLPQDSADSLVDFLCQHGTTIIFSAAVPGQGGQNHLNEQWPKYWQGKFSRHGFFFHDVWRPRLWSSPEVQWWYKQNIFLVSRQPTDAPALPLVHPELFHSVILSIESYQQGNVGVRVALQGLLRALVRYFRK